jgi:hypothetical protein
MFSPMKTNTKTGTSSRRTSFSQSREAGVNDMLGSLNLKHTAEGETHWEQFQKKKRQIQEGMNATMIKVDLLNIAEVKRGNFREIRGLTDLYKVIEKMKAKGLDNMSSIEQTKAMDMLRNILSKHETKSGQPSGADILTIGNHEERGRNIMELITDKLESTLITISKKPKLKSETTGSPSSISKDMGDEAEEEDTIEQGGEKTTATTTYSAKHVDEIDVTDQDVKDQVEQLKEELACWKYIQQQDNVVETLQQMSEHMETFLSVEYVQALMNHGNEQINSIMRVMCENQETSRALLDARNNPVVKGKNSVECLLKIPMSVTKVLNRVTLGTKHVTIATYEQAAEKLRAFRLDCNRLGVGGFEAQIEEWKQQAEELRVIVEEVKNGDQSGATEGMELGMPHEWYQLMRWLADINNNTKGLQGENYKLLQPHLMEIERQAEKKSTPLENRFEEVVKELKDLDAKYTSRYSTKPVKEQFALNTEQQGGGGYKRSVNTGATKTPIKAEFKDLCEHTLRQGFCTIKGCKKNAASEKWIRERGECFSVKKGSACRFGQGCRFRHADDAVEINDAMKKKCVHRMGSVNAAAEEADNQ